MNIVSVSKRIVDSLPLVIRRLIVHVPFSMIVGKRYQPMRAHLTKNGIFLTSSEVVLRLNERIERASKLKFYEAYWREANPTSSMISSLADFARFPICRKSDLIAVAPEDRAFDVSGRFLVNTGGTSGQPMAFYQNRDCVALEWAHMHHIWSQLNYERGDLKLTFRGKEIGRQPYVYRPIHNEIVVNTYLPWKEVEVALLELVKKREIRFLHGYPSILADFAENLTQTGSPLLELINRHLKGVFLSSEFPAPHFREKIDSVFSAPSLSWYGHSEMGVLAHEVIGERYRYHIMHTYGFAEAIPDGAGAFRLVCTSFANVVSPFIRYDTGDLINELEYKDGVLSSFRISSGRVGDQVVDRTGHKVSLTALIHGRHHEAFGVINHVQVSQPEPGRVILHVTPRLGHELNEAELIKLFDLSNVDIEFDLKIVDQPIRTAAGKLPLLVS